ncbi:hypothetical protein P7C73_g546, partial [Tremellales sp. Uapishka_1]
MPSRPNKKAKESQRQPQAGPSTTAAIAQPRLFAPFRALGFISDHVPFALQVHSAKGALAVPAVNIVTCLGRSWAMWDAGRMGLVFVGPDAGAAISSLALGGNDIFAAAGTRIIKYLRGKESGVYESREKSLLGKILVFGEQLLALKEDGTGLLVWDISSRELLGEITFHASFTATSLLHPATYLNKIIVGSQQGELQLWNIRTA